MLVLVIENIISRSNKADVINGNTSLFGYFTLGAAFPRFAELQVAARHAPGLCTMRTETFAHDKFAIFPDKHAKANSRTVHGSMILYEAFDFGVGVAFVADLQRVFMNGSPQGPARSPVADNQDAFVGQLLQLGQNFFGALLQSS